MTAVSPKLATPSDLNDESRHTIAATINPLVADAFALYVKTKNYHWHMSGSHYRDYHLMLDEQAEQIFAMIDALAERVRKLGQTTIHSISHIAQLQNVVDDNNAFVEPKMMIQNLMKDNKELSTRLRQAHSICDDNGDIATASLLENYVDETEHRVWFLFETQAD